MNEELYRTINERFNKYVKWNIVQRSHD